MNNTTTLLAISLFFALLPACAQQRPQKAPLIPDQPPTLLPDSASNEKGAQEAAREEGDTTQEKSAEPASDEKKSEENKVDSSNESAVEAPISLQGLTHQNLAAYDVTKRCEALQEFFTVFVKENAPDVQMQDISCKKDLPFGEIRYQLTFSLVRGSERVGINIKIEQYLSRRFDLQFCTGTEYRLTCYSKNSNIVELASMDKDLNRMLAPFEDFVVAEDKNPAIFGRAYPEFAQAAMKSVELDGLTLNYKDGPVDVKVDFLPDAEDPLQARGGVQFTAVPASIFDNASKTPKFFGCANLECANDGSVTYQFVDEWLILSRTLPGDRPGETKSYFATWKFTNYPE